MQRKPFRAQQPAVLGKLKIAKSGPSQRGLAGGWNSNLGPVRFIQTSNQVTGSLRFPNGAVAVIRGTVQGNRLDFGWGIEGKEIGTGVLTSIDGGRSWTGSYRDNSQGTSGEFRLTRKSG